MRTLRISSQISCISYCAVSYSCHVVHPITNTESWLRVLSFDHFLLVPLPTPSTLITTNLISCFFLIRHIGEIIQCFVFLIYFCLEFYRFSNKQCSLLLGLDLTVCSDKDWLFCFQFGKLSVNLWHLHVSRTKRWTVWEAGCCGLLSEEPCFPSSSMTLLGLSRYAKICVKNQMCTHLEWHVTFHSMSQRKREGQCWGIGEREQSRWRMMGHFWDWSFPGWRECFYELSFSDCYI